MLRRPGIVIANGKLKHAPPLAIVVFDAEVPKGLRKRGVKPVENGIVTSRIVDFGADERT